MVRVRGRVRGSRVTGARPGRAPWLGVGVGVGVAELLEQGPGARLALRVVFLHRLEQLVFLVGVEVGVRVRVGVGVRVEVRVRGPRAGVRVRVRVKQNSACSGWEHCGARWG